MHHTRAAKILSLLLTTAILLSVCPQFALAAATLKSAPLVNNTGTTNGMVRVYLASLGNPSQLDITVQGSYTVNGSSNKTLASGCKVRVNFDSVTGKLTFTSGGVTTAMGSSFKLRRHSTTGTNGLKIAQARVSANLYPGDLNFIVQSSGGAYKLYVIAYIFIEDYLYGVVPYEMGTSSPLEALKAQAVTARTYALRAMLAATSRIYDVVDGTGDQVFSGVPSATTNCTKAVDATKGIVSKNGTAFTATYYTASNGGQIEAVKNIWGSTAYNYISVKDDPYDLANPDSKVRTATIYKVFSANATGIQNLILEKAKASLGTSNVTISTITGLTPHTPRYAAPSRLYTKMDVSFSGSVNGVQRNTTVTFDIFPELESALSLSINSASNELWTVTDNSTSYSVQARRYGHGTGMSQRGAMQMGKLGFTYDQILEFYFEGCTRVQYNFTKSILSEVVSGSDSSEEITVVPPADIEEGSTEGTLTAVVTTTSGSLNLRKSASTSAAVIANIPKNAVVRVTEKGSTWCQVIYNGITGYAMTTFLVFQGDAATTAPTAAPSATATPAPDSGNSDSQTQFASVITPSGSLNMRKSASSNAQVIARIPQSATILILDKGAAWCKATYNGNTGYVMTSFLLFISQSATAAPTAAPSVTSAPTDANGTSFDALVNTASGSLNMRISPQSGAKIIARIPQYAHVSVMSKGSMWTGVSYGGQYGYVMTVYLKFTDTQAPVVTKTPMPAPTAAPQTGSTTQARVYTENGKSLNLREKKSSSATVLTTVPYGDIVLVYDKGSTWCYITYNGFAGYVMTKFLNFNVSTSVTVPSVSATKTPAPVQSNDDAMRDPTLVAMPAGGFALAQINSTQSSLNLRVGCSTNATLICEMKKGDYVTLLERGNEWCRVEYEGKQGYCMTKYLEFHDGW